MKYSSQITLLCGILFLLSSPLFGQKIKNNPKKDYVVHIHTDLGDMVLILYDKTPEHKKNFIKLVSEGFYDSTRFHRVIKNFMIQGGDPLSKPGGDMSKAGTGGPGYTIPAEFVPEYKHVKGAIAAARMGDGANPSKASSGSQFYFVHSENGCKHLNGSYTVFGQVIQGMEVIDEIASQPVNRQRGNRPTKDIRISMEVQYLKKKKITKLYGYEFP